MRVLVCGGRDFQDETYLFEVMDRLHAVKRFTAVVHGAARGADTLGARWAAAHGIPAIAIPAEWTAYGKAAGGIRNQRMLDEEHPELVVAFPGGPGTADMVRRARKAKVPVLSARHRDENGE